MAQPVRIAALVIAVCAQWALASAQNVYRCGDSYSSQPCPGATLVLAEDPRSAAQRAANEAATRRDAKTAAAMEKERVKLEAQPAQATIPPAQVEPPEPLAERPVAKRKSKPRKTELFTAVAPKKAGDPSAKKGKDHKPAKSAAT